MKKKKRLVFLFATHFYSEDILREFKKIKKATESLGDCFILYHTKPGEKVNKEILNEPHFFVSNKLLEKLKYKINIPNNLVPGHNNMALIYFAKNKKYDYYWYIEYDVRFTGNWSYFFNHFNGSDSDFLSAKIEKYSFSNRNWYWWNDIKKNKENIENNEKISSFYPLYRISNRAVDFIDECYKNGWMGHHEVLMPTLLYKNGFKIEDFGGNGLFVSQNNKNKFYRRDILLSSTFQYKKIRKHLFYLPSGKLVHPVK